MLNIFRLSSVVESRTSACDLDGTGSMALIINGHKVYYLFGWNEEKIIIKIVTARWQVFSIPVR